MKFTITSITEEGVMGLSDNPIEKPQKDNYESNSKMLNSFRYNMDIIAWERAEANRKEYDVKEDDENSIFVFMATFKSGMRIEGDIKDDQIVNIKLL